MYDKEVANSSGFFKDPVTKVPLTGREPRVIQCTLTETGSLVWPQIKASDGSFIRLTYALWTDEEKQIYKKYRNKDAVQSAHSQVVYTRHADMAVAACDTLIGVWFFNGRKYYILSVKGKYGYCVVAENKLPAGLLDDIYANMEVSE